MKLKLCWIFIGLFMASSGVTAQVNKNSPNPLKKEKSSIQKFLERTARVQHQVIQPKVATNDLLTGIEISYLQEDVWFTGTKIYMEYENGKMVNQETQFLDETEWIPSAVTTKDYQNDLLIRETYQEIDGVTEEMEFTERYSYAYTNGILNEIMYEEWVGDQWVKGYKDNYTVENGMITEGITSYWEEGEWEPTLSYTFEEVNDTLIATTQYTDFVGGWDNIERDLYPNLTKEELYEYELKIIQSVELSLLLSFIQYPDYIYQEWDGAKWVNSEGQYTTLYNNPDQTLDLKYVNMLNWEEGEWKPYTSWVQYYNGKVSPDSTVLSIFTDDGMTQGWMVYMKENYTYNTANLYDEITTVLYPFLSTEFSYRYKFEWNGVSTGIDEPEYVASFRLNPSYPNPFNPTTNITYSLEKTGLVNISVYDILGKKVATLVNNVQTAGDHLVQFNADQLSSGLYLVKMETDGSSRTQKITLMK